MGISIGLRLDFGSVSRLDFGWIADGYFGWTSAEFRLHFDWTGSQELSAAAELALGKLWRGFHSERLLLKAKSAVAQVFETASEVSNRVHHGSKQSLRPEQEVESFRTSSKSLHVDNTIQVNVMFDM